MKRRQKSSSSTRGRGGGGPMPTLAAALLFLFCCLTFLSSRGSHAFVSPPSRTVRTEVAAPPAVSPVGRFARNNRGGRGGGGGGDDDDDDQDGADPPGASTDGAARPTRRDALGRGAASLAAAAATAAMATRAPPAGAVDLDLPNFLLPPDRRTDGPSASPKPGKRATAYLVDSTIPPSLVPFKASREATILKQLGQGSGTAKGPYLQEQITLNNMMNKAVFGTAKFVGDLVRGGPEDPRSGRGYATFLFLGADYASGDDAALAEGILTEVLKPRRDVPTALGLAFAPRSAQGTLDRYARGEEGEAGLVEDLTEAAGTSADNRAAVGTYLPLLRLARSGGLSLLALAPEPEDVRTVRTQGLQNVDVGRRARYVKDSEGFIALTQDPKFRLYTEKSLLRDYAPLSSDDSPGDYFAERILFHEACATAAAEWAAPRPDSLVVALAPTADVRYMGGMNGRVPRICRRLDPEESKVDEECVTTILLNPTAETTLSASKFLRLEIGTSPSNLPYQTKVADYLWFSRSPRVNMLPRMMNYA